MSLRWGLIPFFTKDIKDVKGISIINARAKTGVTSRTYREPSCQPQASAPSACSIAMSCFVSKTTISNQSNQLDQSKRPSMS